jgi:hypothetical protein
VIRWALEHPDALLFVIVIALIAYGEFKARREPRDPYDDDQHYHW